MDSKTSRDETRVSHPIYNLLPGEIEGFDSLAELALGRQDATDSAETLLLLGGMYRSLRAKEITLEPLLNVRLNLAGEQLAGGCAGSRKELFGTILLF